MNKYFLCSLLLLMPAVPLADGQDEGLPAEVDTQTQLLWGDTHLHTKYSFDAFLNENHSATPDTAYRWAKGEPVIHPENRVRVQIKTPLDFLVVSDHAEEIGVFATLILEGNDLLAPMGLWDSLRRWVQMKLAKYLNQKGLLWFLFY